MTTVGASSSNRAHQTTLQLVASNGDRLNLVGSTITPGIGSAPVVLATSIPGVDALCVNPIPPGAATGKIVACQRGPNRVLKSFNVMNGGGVGMILYNAGLEFVMTDNHWVPSIHIQGPTDIVPFLTGHTGVTGSWANSVKTAIRGDVMTFFSSRGPLGDFVKPDVTAPGIQILAGMTPTPASPVGGPPGQLFQAIGGTSMSSPHSAGASALVKAAHPSWTPAMIKSALMTSAAQDVLKEDGVTPFDPFDAGAGSIRVNRAVDPTLVFDETFADFVASAADPLHRIDLNIASVNAPTMTGLDHDVADGAQRLRPRAGARREDAGARGRDDHGRALEQEHPREEEPRRSRSRSRSRRRRCRTGSTSGASRSIRRRRARTR